MKVAASMLFMMGIASPAVAQFSAVGTRDLAFGAIIPGVVTTVAPTDPVKSGSFDITANIGTAFVSILSCPPGWSARRGPRCQSISPTANVSFWKPHPAVRPTARIPKA